MSKSKSYLPDGGYTLTQGSNYMMDGFNFDTEYGGGPQEKARLPESKGLADLPSGMVPLESSGVSMLPDGIENEVDLNMGEITREANQEINIVDHSWLATEAAPDLSGQIEMEEVYKNLAEGHMNNKEYNSLKSLEEAWGQTSTTGLDIIPNSNREHEPYRNPYRNDVSKLPADNYREMMEKNVRKLAYGHSLSDVLLGVRESNVLEVKSKLASEYGLHGRVYIKEEYFPGLFNGRWNEVINKRCATSMFIIPKNEDCAYDRFLGMEVVNSIPWKKASKTLLPKLESYGVRVATGSSKNKLQRAFIDLIEGRVARQEMSATWFPTQQDSSSLVSLDHARRELETAREENIFIASVEEVEQTKIEKKLQRIAKQLITQGFLDEEQVTAILDSSDKSASKKISRLYELASQPVQSSSYVGQGRNASYHNMRKQHTDANAHIPQKSSRELAARKKVVQKKIAGLISANLITIEEVQKIAKGSSPEDKLISILKHIGNKKDKVATYQGEKDNFEGRLTSSKLASLQKAFFSKQSSRSKKDYKKTVMSQINTLIQTGVVSMGDFENIVKKHASLDLRLQALFQLVRKPVHVKKASGQKGHYGTKVSKSAEINYTDLDWSKAQEKVSKLISSGLLKQEQADSLSNAENPKDYIRKAFDLASKPERATQYLGEEKAHILNGSKKSSHMSATEKKVSSWIRQKISEGSAGQELDLLLATRFSQSVLNEYSSRIASIRSEHEGVSGHAYVDAKAYMTNGTEGCDKGALVHRANKIPTLMKTSKCGGCVFNSGGSCQKYCKPIVASVNEVVANKESFQKEMIRLANANDSEQTASLFVNNYDTNEFNLTANEDVPVDDSVSSEYLGDVLFGGFEI
jgi:hypothetical protein